MPLLNMSPYVCMKPSAEETPFCALGLWSTLPLLLWHTYGSIPLLRQMNLPNLVVNHKTYSTFVLLTYGLLLYASVTHTDLFLFTYVDEVSSGAFDA